MKRISIIALLLTACANSQTGIQIREYEGDVQVSPSVVDIYDYQVFINAGFDFGYSTNNAEDRLGTVSAAMKRHCAQFRIVDEKSVSRAETPLGADLVDYYYFVKCS